jgi:hypothetical protein
MRRLACLFATAFLLLASARPAEPVELASGLRYLRVASLEKSAPDLTEALLKPSALVLDLRYVADEAGAAAVLGVLKSQPAKPRLYVLVSPETPKRVAEALKESTTPLVTLGIAQARPEPKVVVDQSRADDRAAYAALENGTALAALVSGKVDKEHFDEAELVKEFKNGNPDARPTEGNPDAAKAPPAVTDRVLQRALHLHRALQALQR